MELLLEKFQTLSSKIQQRKDLIQTEEGTKNAFVLPFISALGYDIFEPMEVVPEFTADADLLGIKKGEKVDYAIKRDGKVIMLFECKAAHTNLDGEHASQLFRYFSVTDTRIAVLTNGIIYRFYSDIEQSHKMDATPFMEFNMLNIQENVVPELKSLTKQAFNLEAIISVAGEMKYSREIKRILGEELNAPTDDFVRFLTHRVYKGIITQSIRELFAKIVKKAFTQFIDETINERLRPAMAMPLPDKTGGRVPTQLQNNRAEKAWRTRRVTLSDLVNAGLLPSDAVLEVQIHGVTHSGRLRDGQIEIDGHSYPNPSSASIALRQVKSYNGWTDWQYKGDILAKIREKYEMTKTVPQ